MKILIVDRGIIPAKLYGGTERVIWYLGKELAKLGHNIIYLVGKGSSCSFAEVVYIDYRWGIAEQIPKDVDLVHLNFMPEDINQINKPYVVTVHWNLYKQNEFDLNSIFVSQNHAARYGSDSFVYNGLDWDDYSKPVFSEPRKYFHFLGKAAWRVKNVKGAINVITRTKSEKIKILGGVRFNFKMGMRFTFTPRASFYGMVGGKKKDDLLKHSKGLIFPVRWHEPFGLSIIESLYFGCPVFGTPYGSLPEIVTPEVGFLSKNSTELVHAVENVGDYSNKYCHDYVVEHFNSRKMALSYLEKYERVLSNEKLNDNFPKLKQVQKKKFLEWT